MKTSYSIPDNLDLLLSIASEETGISKPRLLKRCFFEQLRYMNESEITHGIVVLYNERTGNGTKQ